jgi:hypothetical protein
VTLDLYAPLSDLYARFWLAAWVDTIKQPLRLVYGQSILPCSVVPLSHWFLSDCVQTQADRSDHKSPLHSTNINASVINGLNVNNSILDCDTVPNVVTAATEVHDSTAAIEVHDSSSDEESDESIPVPHPSALDIEFRRTYDGFDGSRKWRLSSGRVVEDTLYNAYWDEQSSTVDSLVRDWTIDLDNKTMRDWFSAAEWAEISGSIPPPPPPKENLVRSFSRFRNVQTTDDLRRVLKTVDYLPDGVSFNRDEHFDLEWADTVVRELYFLCGRRKADNQPYIVFSNCVTVCFSLIHRTNPCASLISKAGIRHTFGP